MKRFPSFAADHFHQTEGCHVNDLAVYPVFFTFFRQKGQEFLPLFFFLHIDEINEDDAGQVSEAQLSGNFHGRLPVHLIKNLVGVFFLFGDAAAVDINDQTAAGRQPDGFLKGGFIKMVKTVQLLQRVCVSIKRDPADTV